MKYLLDSETISSFYNEADKYYEIINEKILSLNDDELYVSVLTLYELEYGRANAPKELLPMLRKRTQLTQSDFTILPVAPEGASLFGDSKKALSTHWGVKKEESNQKKMKRHNVDIMLASTAMVENAILVSADKIYPEIVKFNPQFRFENWTI